MKTCDRKKGDRSMYSNRSVIFSASYTRIFNQWKTSVNSFKSLVEEQKSREEVVPLFGVMLYTDSHPHIKKVLRDDDYWLALHELTGNNFAVFSVRPEKGSYETPSMPRGFTGFMVKIWKEPKENKQLIELFEIENTEKLPSLLLFTEINHQYFSIQLPIDDSTENSAYHSIQEHLNFALEVISGIRKENQDNPEGIFAALSMRHNDNNTWKALKNCMNIYKKIKELLP
ncbi:hypothetical protein ACYZUA_19485 [Pseudomonas sp. LS2P72]